MEKVTLADVVEVRDFLYENYFKESIYSSNMQYDAEASLEYIKSWVGELFYMVRVEGEIAGVFAATIAKTYYKQPECQVIVFYVHPDCRGIGVSRDMVQQLVALCDAEGVAAIYTTSASGIGEKNNELYTNLFGKFGFQKLGTELVRFNNV